MGVCHSASKNENVVRAVLTFETCAGAVVSARVAVVRRGRRPRARGLSKPGATFVVSAAAAFLTTMALRRL